MVALTQTRRTPSSMGRKYTDAGSRWENDRCRRRAPFARRRLATCRPFPSIAISSPDDQRAAECGGNMHSGINVRRTHSKTRWYSSSRTCQWGCPSTRTRAACRRPEARNGSVPQTDETVAASVPAPLSESHPTGHRGLISLPIRLPVTHQMRPRPCCW